MDLESLDKYLLTCFGKRTVALFNTLYYAYEDGYISPDLYREILLRYFCNRSQLKFTLFEDTDEIIFVYPTNELIERFLKYPQTLQITGIRRSGKSVASYMIGTEWKEFYSNGRIYVWGDWDMITPFEKPGWYRIISSGIPEELRKILYDPSRDFPILLIYDELTYTTTVGLHYTRESRKADMMVRQIRHLGSSEMAGVWIIYLATVYSALQKQKRLEADLTLDLYSVGSPLYERLDVIRDPQIKYIYSKILPQLPKPMPNEEIKINYGLGCIDEYKITMQPIIMPKWLKKRIKMSKEERVKLYNQYRHKNIGKEELEIIEKDGIELKCQKCGYAWLYKGKSKNYAWCPSCNSRIRLDVVDVETNI